MKKLAIVLLAAVLGGCGASEASKSGSGAPPDVSASPSASASSLRADVSGFSGEELQAIQDKITSNWSELQDKHALAMQFVFSTEDAVKMEVRSYGDFEREPTPEDLDAFRESLFELAGGEFPLAIGVRECCEGPPFATGIIKTVENGRVLIVNENKKNGNTDDPEAYWIELTPDGKLFDGESEPTSQIDESLVGKEAKAWTTGMVNQSYPGQTSAIKIVVE